MSMLPVAKPDFLCQIASMKRPSLYAAALLAGIGMLSQLEARTWTDAKSGKKIEAEFVKTSGGKVTLKLANGKTVPLDITRLSQADQDFIKSQGSGESSAGASEWPQWRGANGSNISPDKAISKSWPDGGPKLLWVYKDGGQGYSGPSIVNGTLYTMGSRDGKLMVIALNADSGEEVWASQIGDDDEEGYSAGWGGGPRSTPTWNDGHVYALGPKGTLACLNAEDGKKIWDKNLSSDFGGKAGGWGYSESPFVDGDLVIVAPGGSKSAVVALNKKTGKTKWETENDAGKAEYASMVPADLNGGRQYIRFFQTKVLGLDSTNGKVLWESEWPRGKTAVIPTPIYDNQEVYITSGYGAGGKMFKISSDNSVSDVWDNKVMQNHHGGVIKIGDHVYGFSNKGLICQDWKTGEQVWAQKDRSLSKGAITVAGGKLICVNEADGTVTLVEASPKGFESHGSFKLEPQSENRNPKGRIWTHPVVLNGKLYLRDQELIHCFDVSP